MKTFDKKGEKKSSLVGVLLAVMVIAIIGIGLLMAKQSGVFSTGAGSNDPVETGNCPTDGDSSLTFDFYNDLNTTAAENLDVKAVLYQQEGSSWVKKATLTDTTAPTAITVDCGYRYKICGIAGNADGGNNSIFKSVRNGDATIVDGCAVFDADRSNEVVAVGGEQHDVLTFRVYDKTDARFAFDTGDAESATFEADGTTFTDGDNATAFAIASGGLLDINVEMKGASEDEDFEDAYVLVLVEAPISEYKTPLVKFEGITLIDISESGLTSQEEKQFDSYEYIYKIESNIGNSPKTLGVYIEAAAGTDPSTDLQIDFASAGNYLSTDGVTLKTGAADDTSSNAVVYTVQDVTIDMS